MNQYYNPQGYQAYPGAGATRQQGMPYTGQPGYQQMQPPSGAGLGGPATGGLTTGMPGGMTTAMPGMESMGGMPGMPGMPGMGGMAGMGAAPTSNIPGMLPIEQSYIENILRLNKGKLVHVFTTFESNEKWNAKEFVGVIEAAGRDHLILSDPQTGKRFLIPMVHLDYVTFDEEVEYEYPYGAAPLATYPPR
jgi:spore germination protein Q